MGDMAQIVYAFSLMCRYIAKIRRGTAIVDVIIIIGGTEVLCDSICIIGYNTKSDRDRIRCNILRSNSGSSSSISSSNIRTFGFVQ